MWYCLYSVDYVRLSKTLEVEEGRTRRLVVQSDLGGLDCSVATITTDCVLKGKFIHQCVGLFIYLTTTDWLLGYLCWESVVAAHSKYLTCNQCKNCVYNIKQVSAQFLGQYSDNSYF